MCSRTAGFLALFVCAASNGQSVNVDFHDVDGTPTSDYGAAGLPGFWNSFTTTAGVDTPLLGLDGAPTGVTLRHNGAGYQRESSQTTVGNDSALLRDYLFSVGPAITLEFAGLANGIYESYTYAYFHETYPFSTDVWINADLDTLVDNKDTGRHYSVYSLLHGVVQHDLYHAGQIVMLKKALNA